MSADFAIPDGLVRCRTEMYGEDGVAWLGRLPAIVATCARRWSLDVDGAFPGLSYNYVAPATRSGAAAAVLKVCYIEPEFYTEAEALRLYDGRGCTRLLAVDLEQGAMLIERALPGVALSTVADAEEVADVAAAVMQRLWRPLPAEHSLPSVDTWMANMARRSQSVRVKAPAFAWDMVERALDLYRELASSGGEWVLLHGDLHQGNILTATREPWLAIDPKGIAGPRIWETGPLLLNAFDDDTPTVEACRILERMVARLSEALGFEGDELRAWGAVRAVLSSYWTVEENDQAWEGALRCARLLGMG